MPINTLDRINNLLIEQLESLGEALLDFGAISDLTRWLETQGSRRSKRSPQPLSS